MSRTIKLGRIGKRGRRNPSRERKRNPSGDEVTAHELALYAVNNAELYRQRIVPVIQNLQRKIKRGVYDPALAPKIWRYVADDAAKRYLREFGGASTGYDYFTVPIRVAAAREIAEHYSDELTQRNPCIRGMGPPSAMRHLRGKARHVSDRFPGIADHYYVQVKRGAAWIALASFGNNLNGKARATEYGKLLARRYPRQKFRVFWQDKIKNPRLSAPRSNGGASQTFRKIAYAAGRDAGNRSMRVAGRTRWSKKDFNAAAREFERLTRKKNPAPLTSRVNGAEVDQAARLFQSFTGQRVTRARQVNLPKPKVGLAIGPVLSISYATTRDGKRENYQHDFRRGARPLLAASQDGRTLLLLSGAYRFTSRGIVDRA